MIHSSLLALILRLSPPHVINVSPQVLLESFEASMHVLEDLTEKNQRRVDKLEHVCVRREEEHRNRIKDLDSTYSVSDL